MIPNMLRNGELTLVDIQIQNTDTLKIILNEAMINKTLRGEDPGELRIGLISLLLGVIR